MDVQDRVSRLDERRSTSAAPRSRARVIATVLLLTGLVVAWLSFARGSGGTPASIPAKHSPPTVPNEQQTDTTRLRALFADAGDCRDVFDAMPRVSCEIDGVTVDARLFSVVDAQNTYAARLRVRIRPGRGAAACARGAADERSWSRASDPAVALGRYRCRIEAGHAALWWTDEHGVLAHAVGANRDLKQLFRWWLVHRDA
jgi:hypothetical protein